MIEDKLSPDERLRLECLNQAINCRRPTESAEGTIQRASEFEKYVREGTGV
jgi:hypothetical protein